MYISSMFVVARVFAVSLVAPQNPLPKPTAHAWRSLEAAEPEKEEIEKLDASAVRR